MYEYVSFFGMEINPFSTLIPFNGIRHFGPVPTAPVTPARRSKASRGGYGFYLEVTTHEVPVPRAPTAEASRGQSRRPARALAVAVRVV